MALDTAAKRRSAIGVSYHYYSPGVTPDATPGVEWRQQSGHGLSSIAAAQPVEVPNVVGETEAAGTTTLETALFVVSVSTAYSASVALGLIISQDPAGGAFAAEGSTVGIVVSLGPEPAATNLGGDDAPPRKQKDYRPELDEKRLQEQRELRESIERAAGLIDDAIEQAEEAEQPQVVQQATALNVELGKLRQYAEAIEPQRDLALDAIQARVDGLIAQSADALIDEITAALTDLIQEISEDDF